MARSGAAEIERGKATGGEVPPAGAAPVEALGADGAEELLRLLAPLAERVIERKAISSAVRRIVPEGV